jgi:exodeoxyribonuclease V, gamma subunit
MLISYHSNRIEKLADQLAEVVREPLSLPLSPEIVVVQSIGMARWLSLRLADRLGICANVRFPFPARFIWEAFRAVLPDLPETSPYAPAVMTWRLIKLLDEAQRKEAFALVRAYLREGDDVRRYELAHRIAGTFDQYLVYRPDWIQVWEAGQEDHWQAELWRRLAAISDGPHWIRVSESFLAALDADPALHAHLPARVALFGISALSPAYLNLIGRLAQFIDVHLFVLNPCRHYWGDIESARGIARRAGEQDPDALHFETSNPLLASLGKQGRDFIDMIQEYQGQEAEYFEEPDGKGLQHAVLLHAVLLHAVQADILDLRNRAEEPGSRTPVHPDDRSLQVHVCHSPMREVEVLHDQLLDLFERNPGLAPSDIVVMTPDIDAYAPYIEAVFATAPEARRIPFGIADRSFLLENPLVDAFFSLLNLPGSRFDVKRVLALLDTAALRRRFGLVDADLERAHRWVQESGIRWGIDSGSRSELNLPATAEHTWRTGLNRLLLGYALPGEALFKGVLPYDGVEGKEARVMGALQAFAEAVFALNAQLNGKHSPATWALMLQALLKRFFEPVDAEVFELQTICQALESMAEAAQQAGFDEPVSLPVVASCVRRHLESSGSAKGFLGKGITFCAMVPMRSIPFEVVCLIGMNDGSFSRARHPLSFDLMEGNFRRGDRARRNDYRYLFLEALLVARRCLYLSYVGNSIRDNSVIPPSVLVNELLEYVCQGFYPQGNERGDILDQVVTRHPLQAFSYRYFTGDSGLFSYSHEFAEASRAAAQVSSNPEPFIVDRLPEPEDDWRTVDLEQLIRFLICPIRYLLRQRLGIHLEAHVGLLETREPFVLDGATECCLREQLLSRRLRGEQLADALPLIRAGGALPHGQVGEFLYRRELDTVNAFAQKVEGLMASGKQGPLEVDLRLGSMRLTGLLTGVVPEGLLAYRLARSQAPDWLALWVRHLVLNHLAPPGVKRMSRCLGEDREIVLGPVQNSESHLEGLLEHYWKGLTRPLHFFARSALEYIKTLNSDKATTQPLAAARRIWEGSDQHWGESQDPYHQLTFRTSDPLDAEFEALAVAIFQPVFDHLVG